MKKCILLLASIVLLTQCKTTPKDEKAKAPLFNNLGNHSLKVTTNSPLAQKFFNQGVILSYGFNHAEAARSFREAVRLDSSCAMCHWGVAYVLGPNINATMKEESVKEAYSSIQSALKFSEEAEEWEKAVILALSKRYINKSLEDRSELDKAYSEGMKEAYLKFPENPDIASWYAESMMDLYPWNYWTRDGKPQPWTPRIISVLEKLLQEHPMHPGANHMYIHAMEASGEPEKALPSAAKLGGLAPGAGHLVHMPSHIYIRTGRYHEGSEANEKAVLADSTYITACHAQGDYPLLIFPHNYHFLAATATLEGRGKRAIEAAYQVANHTDKKLMKDSKWGTLQHFYIIPYYVLVKFAQWDYILSLKAPDKNIKYQKAIWHYARGMAYAGKSELGPAQIELDSLQLIELDTSLKNLKIWETNSVHDLIRIAGNILEADIVQKKGNFEKAITLLKESVAIEDAFTYQEPPDWFFSVRHSLGATLLDAGKYKEAEKTFLEDLKLYRENGWALSGLLESLLKQNKKEEANSVESRLDKAWKWADAELNASRVKPLVLKIDKKALEPSHLFAQVQEENVCGKR